MKNLYKVNKNNLVIKLITNPNWVQLMKLVKILSCIMSLVGLIIPASAESLTPSCNKNINEQMIGTQRIKVITYDCKYEKVIQHGLTDQERILLQSLTEARANGTYVKPPEDTNYGITAFDNPLCNIGHFDKAIKIEYGCY